MKRSTHITILLILALLGKRRRFTHISTQSGRTLAVNLFLKDRIRDLVWAFTELPPFSSIPKVVPAPEDIYRPENDPFLKLPWDSLFFCGLFLMTTYVYVEGIWIEWSSTSSFPGRPSGGHSFSSSRSVSNDSDRSHEHHCLRVPRRPVVSRCSLGAPEHEAWRGSKVPFRRMGDQPPQRFFSDLLCPARSITGPDITFLLENLDMIRRLWACGIRVMLLLAVALFTFDAVIAGLQYPAIGCLALAVASWQKIRKGWHVSTAVGSARFSELRRPSGRQIARRLRD